MDKWTRWHGGTPPQVKGNVDVRFKDGTVVRDRPVSRWEWTRQGDEGDIAAYQETKS